MQCAASGRLAGRGQPPAGWDNRPVPWPFDPPVVLAPMAGITNRAFRRLCREARGGHRPGRRALRLGDGHLAGAGRAQRRDAWTWSRFEPDETPRSVQLYGVDPHVMAAAVRILVDEDRADHVDLNFGCPVPKVTRKGGGSALPWKRDLFRSIVTRGGRGGRRTGARLRQDAQGHRRRPPDLPRRRPSGRRGGRRLGRPARSHRGQMYAGTADWDAIARLKEELGPYGTPGARQRRHLDGRATRCA